MAKNKKRCKNEDDERSEEKTSEPKRKTRCKNETEDETEDDWDAMFQQLVMVKSDTLGRPQIPQNDPNLPFFEGQAPPGHTQPWVFKGWKKATSQFQRSRTRAKYAKRVKTDREVAVEADDVAVKTEGEVAEEADDVKTVVAEEADDVLTVEYVFDEEGVQLEWKHNTNSQLAFFDDDDMDDVCTKCFRGHPEAMKLWETIWEWGEEEATGTNITMTRTSSVHYPCGTVEVVFS